jgi:hypothetical protein
LNNGGTTTAIFWVDNKPDDNESKPTHFMIGKKNENGTWLSLDQADVNVKDQANARDKKIIKEYYSEYKLYKKVNNLIVYKHPE